MFSRIVIGVDGRSGGQDAIRLARRLAGPSTELVAACVVVGGGPEDAARATLDEATAGREDVRGEVVAAHSVAEGLQGTATRLGADLLVVGSCHRGVFGRLTLGDDARQTLRDAPCAVASAPDGYRHRDAPIRTVGVGLDSRAESDAALAAARVIAADERAALRALHVVPVATWVALPGAYAGGDIDAAVHEASEHLAGLDGVAGTAVVGSVVDELCAFGREVDLLVVGTRHRSRAGHVVLGSTAEMLGSHVTVPLLVIPSTAVPAAATEPAARADRAG